MPVFERDGLAFDYLDEGDPWGAPLCLPARGLGGDVSQPAGVFSPLLGIRLLSLDCRGHGGRIPSAARRSPPSRPSPTTSQRWI